MSPEETNTLIMIIPKKNNLSQAQDKNFKEATMNMFEDLKQDMNKNKDCENTKERELNNVNNSI